MGDMFQSIGVFIAALVIYFKPEWAIADPICTFIFSIIVLITTFSIIKDAVLVSVQRDVIYMIFNIIKATPILLWQTGFHLIPGTYLANGHSTTTTDSMRSIIRS